jgi:SAM-dependent methyltransferase
VQYQLLKIAFGYNDILDLPLDISNTQEPVNILDIATGTGAWILDVSRIPEIQSRLPELGVVNPVNLYACDISTAKLPEKFTTNQHGINFFLQDVTQPFLDNMKGKFDIIHTALLSWALTEEGWKAASRNVYELLSRSMLSNIYPFSQHFSCACL